MNKLRLALVAIATFMFPLAPAVADDLAVCGREAAVEFGVPEKVFEALAGSYGWNSLNEETRKRAEERGEYGPMGIGEHALVEIAQQLGSSVDALKSDPCENYRGAAWWLMNPAGGKDGDIWEAVNRYFYGHSQHRSYPITERVRAYYDSL